MGSADDKQANSTGEKLVSVETNDLKERLNRLYGRLRQAASSESRRTEQGHFDSLWDLKELALMQRRQSVDVPEAWLAETEALVERDPVEHGS